MGELLYESWAIDLDVKGHAFRYRFNHVGIDSMSYSFVFWIYYFAKNPFPRVINDLCQCKKAFMNEEQIHCCLISFYSLP